MMISQFDYSHRDWQVAAETLGEQVRHLLHIVVNLPDGPEPHLSYRKIANDELVRVCVSLTRDAAHAAHQAEAEADTQARYLLNQDARSESARRDFARLVIGK